MLAPRLLLLLVCVAALACGGSPGADPPPQAGSGDDGGGGQGGGGAGSGGTKAAVTVERLDPSAECDGLVPDSVPAPVTASRAIPAGAACLGGTSDGTGHVVVGALAGDVASWQAFGTDGSPLRVFEGDGLAELVPEAEGWTGAVVERDPYGAIERVLRAGFAPDGSPHAPETVTRDPALVQPGAPRIARDPGGGCLVAAGETSRSGNHWSSVAARRFAPGGDPTSGVVVAGTVASPMVDFLVPGVSRDGDALVLWREVGGAIGRAWIAKDGSLRGDAAPDDASWHEGLPSIGYPSGPANLRLEPLLDGSLGLQVQGEWAWTFPHLGVHRDAPQWLRERPGTALRWTRGNRGYAVLPPPRTAAPGCAQRIELLAPSGRVCGTVTFTEGDTACTTGRIDQGWDGTVVQQSALDRCEGRTCSCTVRFWPRLLAKP